MAVLDLGGAQNCRYLVYSGEPPRGTPNSGKPLSGVYLCTTVVFASGFAGRFT